MTKKERVNVYLVPIWSKIKPHVSLPNAFKTEPEILHTMQSITQKINPINSLMKD